jgi:hypothetical protein
MDFTLEIKTVKDAIKQMQLVKSNWIRLKEDPISDELMRSLWDLVEKMEKEEVIDDFYDNIELKSVMRGILTFTKSGGLKTIYSIINTLANEPAGSLQFLCAKMDLHGIGTEVNGKKAFALYEKSAEEGFDLALNELISAYAIARYAPVDGAGGLYVKGERINEPNDDIAESYYNTLQAVQSGTFIKTQPYPEQDRNALAVLNAYLGEGFDAEAVVEKLKKLDALELHPSKLLLRTS